MTRRRLAGLLLAGGLLLTLLPAEALAAELTETAPPPEDFPEVTCEDNVRKPGDGGLTLSNEGDCVITYVANGGSGTGMPDTVAAGTSFTLPDCPFSAPAGQRFLCWNIGGTAYDPGDVCLISGDTTAAAVWTSAFLDSGCLDMEKLTPSEICALLDGISTTTPSDSRPEAIFSEEPSCAVPYAPGAVREELLQQLTDRLNALRAMAGLPAAALDADLCENAQYGAVLLAASNFSHRPTQPADMENEFYQKGYAATTTSNLYAGLGLMATADGFMDDSDGGNVSRLGHRRWQLNPSLGKVGFGYALSSGSYRRYTVEKVFDRSGTYGDYDFVGWPASGYFPSDSFGWNVAWSVTLNPRKYATPDMSRVKVTLRRESDGAEQTFSGDESYKAASSGAYFNVDTGGYGVDNCIIFRPDWTEAYEGVYTVEITGLTDRSGDPAELTYQVDFFTMAAARENSYAVTFDLNGGAGEAVTRMETNGTHYSLPLMPARAGYAFDGWYTAPEGGTRITDETRVELRDSQTLYAHWRVQPMLLAEGTLGQTLTWTLTLSGDVRQVSVTGLSDGEGKVYAAGYRANGRMRAVSALTGTRETAVVPEGCTALRLFWLDETGAPRCRAVGVSRS